MKLTFKEKILYGSILLGIGFPILGIIISLKSIGNSFSINGIIEIHQQFPAIYLIDLAPIVLPAVALIVIKLAANEVAMAVKNEEQTNLIQIALVIEQLAAGNYDVNCDMDGVLNEICDELKNLKTKLIANKQLEEERLWESKGFAKFAGIMRDNSESISNLGKEVITELVKYIGAHVGGFYFLNDERKVHKLNLIASYAYDFNLKGESSFEVGEGPVGQCFKDGELRFHDEIPNDYQLNIESGLGTDRPACLVYAPLKANDETVGVIEIGCLDMLEKYKVEFIGKLCESIAISVLNVKTSQKTKDLLEESQFMAQQLQTQEEELRQNAEELQATQEEIERKLSETEHILSAERKKINTIINTSSDGILVLSEKGKIKEYNPSFQKLLGYTKTDLNKISLDKILGLDEDVEEFLKNNLDEIMEHEVKTKDETELWLKLSVNKMEVDGEVSYSMFVSDITEMKHNATTMEESLLEFQNMMMEQSESQAQLQMELETLKEELEEYKNK